LIELVPPGTHIDFVGMRRVTLVISGLALLAGLVAAVTIGPRYGIDFAGGNEVQVRFPETPEASDGPIREVVTACGVREPSVVRYGESDAVEFLINFRPLEEGAASAGDACPITAEQRQALEALREELGLEAGDQGEVVERLRLALGNRIGPVEIERVEFVGPRVGAELRRDGLFALIYACIFILIYIALRFNLRFAPGAVVALIHDIAITAGVFVIFGLEFDLRVLAAMLAILGYSLNDTIIVYDRIRENLALHTKRDLPEVINLSINQTMSRTLLTSGTTLVAVLALLFLGGEVIRTFALAMTVGIVVGTYSSVFIAAITLLYLERWLGDGQAGQGLAAPARTPHPKAGRRAKGRRAAGA